MTGKLASFALAVLLFAPGAVLLFAPGAQGAEEEVLTARLSQKLSALAAEIQAQETGLIQLAAQARRKKAEERHAEAELKARRAETGRALRGFLAAPDAGALRGDLTAFLDGGALLASMTNYAARQRVLLSESLARLAAIRARLKERQQQQILAREKLAKAHNALAAILAQKPKSTISQRLWQQKALDFARADTLAALLALLPKGESGGESGGKNGGDLVLRLPVAGRKESDFGEKGAFAEKSAGLSWQTRAGGLVTAPADGRVVFARAFRHYNHLLIVAAANGYHIIMAGLAEALVQAGEDVGAGEPAGLMPEGSPRLYLEIRHLGRPVDPQPFFTP